MSWDEGQGKKTHFSFFFCDFQASLEANATHENDAIKLYQSQTQHWQMAVFIPYKKVFLGETVFES